MVGGAGAAGDGDGGGGSAGHGDGDSSRRFGNLLDHILATNFLSGYLTDGDLQHLVLHEANHVEQAAVPRRREALPDPKQLDELDGHHGDIPRRRVEEAEHEQRGEALGELRVRVGLEADPVRRALLRRGVDPDLGDASPDAVSVGLERGVHGRQPRPRGVGTPSPAAPPSRAAFHTHVGVVPVPVPSRAAAVPIPSRTTKPPTICNGE
ncbi:hypothetical protein DAI22_03g042801 [Oryza sativa Japonica Group]|nr:hypothetical protein DAI22_03g042801 [Oryza sativa Japonica Group]